MSIDYYSNDELPQWVATITDNGVAHDFTTGWTFTVKLSLGDATPVLTKTSNITGATGGVVTVAWADGDLNVDPGTYRALLTAKRTADSLELTIKETVKVADRG